MVYPLRGHFSLPASAALASFAALPIITTTTTTTIPTTTFATTTAAMALTAQPAALASFATTTFAITTAVMALTACPAALHPPAAALHPPAAVLPTRGTWHLRAAAPRVGLWNEMRREHKVPWLLYKSGQLQESLRNDGLVYVMRKLAAKTLSLWGDLQNLGVIP